MQSLPIAIVAVSWMTFMIVVFFFPAYPDPGVQNMNYAVVVFGMSNSLSTVQVK